MVAKLRAWSASEHALTGGPDDAVGFLTCLAEHGEVAALSRWSATSTEQAHPKPIKLELQSLRASFPHILRAGSVANRILAELLHASEPLSVQRLAGGKGASGGARSNAKAALEVLEREGLAAREGDGWRRGPATLRA